MEKFSNFDTRCCVAQSINAFETIFVFSFGPHKKKITPKWHIWLLVNGCAGAECLRKVIPQKLMNFWKFSKRGGLFRLKKDAGLVF